MLVLGSPDELASLYLPVLTSALETEPFGTVQGIPPWLSKEPVTALCEIKTAPGLFLHSSR